MFPPSSGFATFLNRVRLNPEPLIHPLRLYLEAGIDLPEALRRLSTRVPATLVPMVASLARETAAGMSLKDALEGWRERLAPEIPALLAAGEESGRLPETLERLEEHLRQEAEASRKLIGALAWPILQALMAMGVLGIVLVVQGITGTAGRVPGFGMGSVAPFVVLVAIGVGLAMGWRSLPGVSHGRQALARSRLAGTLGLALDSGLAPGKALELAVCSADRQEWRDRLAEGKRQLRGGKSLGAVLAGWPGMGTELLNAVDHGETTGQLPETMARQAFADRDHGNNLVCRTLMALGGLFWGLSAAAIAYTVFRMYAGYLSLLNI